MTCDCSTPTASTGTRSPGPDLASLPPERLVDLDVRDDLRSGREPFGRIMDAVTALRPDQVLRLRAIFEPAPLYRVLAGRGFEHWTERLADDDWRVWFRRSGEAAGSAGEPDTSAEGDPGDAGSETGAGVVVLDVRGLEPPEPMVRTLEALETLPEGGVLVQVNVREPRFLFPRLEERGFEWEVRTQGPDLVRVFIRRAAPAAGETPPAAPGGAELDVRPIPPRDKHSTIFSVFGALAPGESFVLVNDHDPKPLRYQFQFEHEGRFDWEYLEEGPEVWRVRISRT